MALFGLGRSRALEGGIEGSALIRESEPFGEPGSRTNSGDSIFDLELNRFGTRKYRFTLEVRLPDREPYEIEGQFKVPRKAENTGFLPADVGNALKPGLELPVRVDPADNGSLEIDWDKFLAAPGRKQTQKAANQSAKNRQVAEQLERKPKVRDKLREGNRSAVRGWASAVQMGQMTREAFEAQVNQELECGRMDLADADAARATLD